jgi:hypothetical protein
MDGTGSGASLRTRSVTRLSPAFDLIPSNIPLPAFGPNFTTNYDRTIRPCYNIGEYMAATPSLGQTLFAWGATSGRHRRSRRRRAPTPSQTCSRATVRVCPTAHASQSSKLMTTTAP